MKRKNVWIALGAGLVLLAILAAGAYTAVRLLAQPEQPAAVESGGVRVMQSVVDDGNGPVSVRTTFLPAPELPAEPSAASGVVVSRQDNSVILGTGNIDVTVEVQIDPDTGQETRSVIPRTDGPELEIIIGPDTVLYRDVTDFEADMPTESGERVVQQVVRPAGSADEIEPQMEMSVWGERRGDRVIADVVVFGPMPGA
jgi:hypothetical protein